DRRPRADRPRRAPQHGSAQCGVHGRTPLPVAPLTPTVALALDRCARMRTYTRPLVASLVASLVAALVLILASPVYAGAPTDTLTATVDRIVQILADPALH